LVEHWFTMREVLRSNPIGKDKEEEEEEEEEV
jgi:hypothetical protein